MACSGKWSCICDVCTLNRKREERFYRWAVFALIAAIAVVVIGVELVRAVWIYGDWRCAFADCRIVVDK